MNPKFFVGTDGLLHHCEGEARPRHAVFLLDESGGHHGRGQVTPFVIGDGCGEWKKFGEYYLLKEKTGIYNVRKKQSANRVQVFLNLYGNPDKSS